MNKYINKGINGKESPTLCRDFLIYVKRNNRTDRPGTIVIQFKDYYYDVGDCQYCAYEVLKDSIVFRFSKYANDPIHYFKMAIKGKKSSIKDDPADVNKLREIYAHREVEKFINDGVGYPVYYLPSSDEYVIKLDDKNRKKLF